MQLKIYIYDQMSPVKNTNATVKPWVWLVSLTMLFSVFTFTGSVAESGVRQSQPTQTEQKFSSEHKIKKTAFFQFKIGGTSVDPSIRLARHFDSYRIQYNRIVNETLKRNSKLFIAARKPDQVLLKSYSSRNSDDYFTSI